MRRTHQADLPPPCSIRRQLQSLQVAIGRRGRLAYTSLERDGSLRARRTRHCYRAARTSLRLPENTLRNTPQFAAHNQRWPSERPSHAPQPTLGIRAALPRNPAEKLSSDMYLQRDGREHTQERGLPFVFQLWKRANPSQGMAMNPPWNCNIQGRVANLFFHLHHSGIRTTRCLRRIKDLYLRLVTKVVAGNRSNNALHRAAFEIRRSRRQDRKSIERPARSPNLIPTMRAGFTSCL